MNSDLISRHDAIDEIAKWIGYLDEDMILRIQLGIKKLPSAEPEPHEINYTDCANAMLKMWIDNVLTDREYNHIMDKLNTYWAGRRTDEQFD